MALVYESLLTSSFDWLDGADGTTVISYFDNRADEWKDKIANESFLYAFHDGSNYVTIEANEVNGRSAIVAPTYAFMQAQDTFDNYLSNRSSFTAFVVASIPVGRQLFRFPVSPVGEEWAPYYAAYATAVSAYDGANWRKALRVGGKRLPTDSSEQYMDSWADASTVALYVVQFNWASAALHVGVNGSFAARSGGFQTSGNTAVDGTSYAGSVCNYGRQVSFGRVSSTGDLVICEAIFLRDSILSESNRQIIEGDLAHKWGVPLISGHPYESSPPLPAGAIRIWAIGA